MNALDNASVVVQWHWLTHLEQEIIGDAMQGHALVKFDGRTDERLAELTATAQALAHRVHCMMSDERSASEEFDVKIVPNETDVLGTWMDELHAARIAVLECVCRAIGDRATERTAAYQHAVAAVQGDAISNAILHEAHEAHQHLFDCAWQHVLGDVHRSEVDTARGNATAALSRLFERLPPEARPEVIPSAPPAAAHVDLPQAFEPDETGGTRRGQYMAPGMKRGLLIDALRKHHKAVGTSCANPEPIGSNELADTAGVSRGSASQLCKDHFGGSYAGYFAQCNNGKLGLTLAYLNHEIGFDEITRAVEDDIRQHDE